jgi:hypothetical protein
MVPYSEFLPYVLPYVNGCSVPLAEQILRDVCIDFCTQSLCVQVDHDPISVRENVTTYDFSPPPHTQVHQVMRAWFGPQELFAMNGDSLANAAIQHNTRYPDASVNPGAPRMFRHNIDHTFTLDTPPDAAGSRAITMTVALKPTRSSSRVDSLLFNDYAFEIGQGAVARLLLMAGHGFANPSLAASSNLQYLAARSMARVRSNKALSRSVNRVKPVRF